MFVMSAHVLDKQVDKMLREEGGYYTGCHDDGIDDRIENAQAGTLSVFCFCKIKHFSCAEIQIN